VNECGTEQALQPRVSGDCELEASDTFVFPAHHKSDVGRKLHRESSIVQAIASSKFFANENQCSHPSRTQHKSRIASQVHEGTFVVVRKECCRDVAEWKEIAAHFARLPRKVCSSCKFAQYSLPISRFKEGKVALRRLFIVSPSRLWLPMKELSLSSCCLPTF
jgi:hypothetical protein